MEDTDNFTEICIDNNLVRLVNNKNVNSLLIPTDRSLKWHTDNYIKILLSN